MIYPHAIWYPTDKHGYGKDDTHLNEGICAHSMEGSLAAAFGELNNPDRMASWTFSVAKNGDVYQHVDTSNIAWTNGSKLANKKFWGIEHEGVAGEPLTDPQRNATTALMGWLLDSVGLQPVRHLTLFEHNEMTAYGAAATACPSGRIPWPEIIAGIEEEDMALTIEDKQWFEARFAELKHDLRAEIRADDPLDDEALNTIRSLSAKLDASTAVVAHSHTDG